MFVFIGAQPHSHWLPPEVLRDDKGFLLTGRDSVLAPNFTRLWKESRLPLPLETTVPGIFAAGDVRAGALAMRLAGEYLALT